MPRLTNPRANGIVPGEASGDIPLRPLSRSPDGGSNSNSNNSTQTRVGTPSYIITPEIKEQATNLLRPSHSYTSSSTTITYWGSLPSLSARIRFLRAADAAASTASSDPTKWASRSSCFRTGSKRKFFAHSVLPGLGMLFQGLLLYVWVPMEISWGMYSPRCVLGLRHGGGGSQGEQQEQEQGFAVGGILSGEYNTMLRELGGAIRKGLDGETCGRPFEDTYGVRWDVGSMALGCLCIGILLDSSRRGGPNTTAIMLLIGLVISAIMYAPMSTSSSKMWTITNFLVWTTLCFAVGGEIPVTAVMTTEKSLSAPTTIEKPDPDSRLDVVHRGTKTVLAFALDAWAATVWSACWGKLYRWYASNDGWDHPSVIHLTFSIGYLFASTLAVAVVVYRWRSSSSSSATATTYYVAERAWRNVVRARNIRFPLLKSQRTLFTTFLPRLLAISALWLAYEFVAASAFLVTAMVVGRNNQVVSVVVPFENGGGGVTASYSGGYLSLLELSCGMAGFSMLGAFVSAWLVSHRFVGRKVVYTLSTACSVMVLLCLVFASPDPVVALAPLAFFLRPGPGSMASLMAAESFPVPIRGLGAGFAAGVGKLGILAMLATSRVFPGHLEHMWKVSAVILCVCVLVVWLFVPELSGLGAAEQTRHFVHLVDGKFRRYHGPAVHPVHLSLFERWFGKELGFGVFDGEQDFKDVLGELGQRSWKQGELPHCLEEYLRYANAGGSLGVDAPREV